MHRLRSNVHAAAGNCRIVSPVATARPNGVEPLAWLTDVLGRMVSGRTKATQLGQLLPWSWKADQVEAAIRA